MGVINNNPIVKRPAKTVMILQRIGCFHQCRLSFMRILLRRIKKEQWRFKYQTFSINKKGVGHVVLNAKTPNRTYSLVIFANDLDEEKRSDRVIANEWDTTFTLFDGIPTDKDIKRLEANVPKQEAGRVSESELVLSRANRSVRLFDYVVDTLAKGEQPDQETVHSIGYLMRTTAVYGSGKFGLSDRDFIKDRTEFSAPFQAEMLSVYMMRIFVMDFVEYIAELKAPKTAVKIKPNLRQYFGIGNSTGLGMAPFLINHPILLNNWITTREKALIKVLEVKQATQNEIDHFYKALSNSQKNITMWRSVHKLQVKKIAKLKENVETLANHLDKNNLAPKKPWYQLWLWANDNLSIEAQELLVSLMMEPYGYLVDDLEGELSADEDAQFFINGEQPLAEILTDIKKYYGWILEINWDDKSAQARVWYVSEEKLEPRLGERFEEPIADYEQPLSPGRDAWLLYQDILKYQKSNTNNTTSIATFLLDYPEHRHIVRRIQICRNYPYAEIYDNTIDAQMLPIDMLRLKLSFFGATHFDPRSDRWLRINMFQDSPFPEQLELSSAV